MQEVESSLNRGKEVEAFLGGFQAEKMCIRWLSLSKTGNTIQIRIWEAVDVGDEDYLDIYSFPPRSGEWDFPAQEFTIASIHELRDRLEVESLSFVNKGIVQDEYKDYLEHVV
ncbi:hypothetical protein ACFOEK_20695 [Litoribrevibacter euphylliae]|uniref:Uncharacterized protein n=1 Tax=Litoribrevibacter euphylliae TaxID=1834034 RepID=A0ABV7HP83_9GAMM